MNTRLSRAVPATAVLVLATVVPAAGPAAASPAAFTSCAPDATFHVTSVDIEPQPLVPGKKVVVQATGTLDERLTGGSYTANVSYMGVSVLQRSGSIGELIKLPAAPGPATVSEKLKVPKQAPSGSYELTFSATDQDGATLSCVTVPFRVR